MRPFSVYLAELKREKTNVRYDLAGTTPTAPKITIISDNVEASQSKVYPRLMSKLAAKLRARPEQIALAPGCSQALTVTLAALTNPGDRILIESPAYEPFVATARFLGLRIHRFNRSGEIERDLREIKRLSRSVATILIANPSSPLGHLYSSHDLSRIARIGPPLVVDEIYLPLFDNGAITRLPAKNTIHISGLSKNTGLSFARVGWIRGSRELVQRIEDISTVFNVHMPTPSLQLALSALNRWDELLRPHLKLIKGNLATLHDLPTSHPSAGSFVSLQIPAAFRSGDHFAATLRAKSVGVRSGNLFESPSTVRVSLLADQRKFKSAIKIIRAFYA